MCRGTPGLFTGEQLRSIIPPRPEKPINGQDGPPNPSRNQMKKLLAKGRERVGRALLISVIIFIGVVTC
jgi:hypothetical protein